MVSYILAVITGVLFLGLDQLTKSYVAQNFVLYGEPKEFIPYIIDLVYIHNTGGAWGILGGKTWLLLTVTAIIMFVCIGLLIKYGRHSKLLFWAVTLVIFGGVGNMIDRIFRGGKVIDFLQFAFMPEFPVFNVADCAIVIGAGLLVLYFVLDTVKEIKKTKAEENEEN